MWGGLTLVCLPGKQDPGDHANAEPAQSVTNIQQHFNNKWKKCLFLNVNTTWLIAHGQTKPKIQNTFLMFCKKNLHPTTCCATRRSKAHRCEPTEVCPNHERSRSHIVFILVGTSQVRRSNHSISQPQTTM